MTDATIIRPRIRRAYTGCRYGQLHYRVAGPRMGPRPAIVLLHQNPSSSFEYEGLIAALAVDRRVIAPDTPGYGMSDSPPEPAGMAAYAAAIAEGLDALAHEGELEGPFDVFGYHTGTLLACEMAIAQPSKVRSVALSGIPMYSPQERAEKLEYARDFPAIDDEGTVIIDLLAKLWAYVVGARATGVPLEKAKLNFADKARVLDRFTWAYEGVWSWDYARLERVLQPAVLLQPDEDLRAVSLAAAGLMPSCQIRELPELTRDIFDIAPERVAHELRYFFDRI